jgi:hypothetical protein
MPVQRRPPMPKLPPFALASAAPRPKRPHYLLLFFIIFAAPLYLTHLNLLSLPYFWDELGQFVPASLDILRHGWWIPHSVVPNVHPPGVMAYLAVVYKLGGYSVTLTRVAMMLVASGGLLVLFLLSIELSKGTKGVPAFLPPVFLLASPLFYTQSMMAQLDMPAMVFGLLSLLLFIRRQYWASVVCCVVLVLCKETGVTFPLTFAALLAMQKKWKQALPFGIPALVLASWLIYLKSGTGYWFGDPGFAQYNIDYALHPVRMLLSTLRRLYYVFVAEFRFIGTAVLIVTFYRYRWFVWARPEWRVTLLTGTASLLLVCVLGGAELERYLLPVLPIFYIAVSVALTYHRRRSNLFVISTLMAGLVTSLYWNPPYPFPFENNLAMVDFVRLQANAATFAQSHLQEKRIATAWPYTAALRNPDLGYVSKGMKTVETNNFHLESLKVVPKESYDVLILYTRVWEPEPSFVTMRLTQRFLRRFYGWQPPVTDEDCLQLGLLPTVSWESRGQRITVYVRP